MNSSLISRCHETRVRRCTVLVQGVVQGVGFRPFVYRLAQECDLRGSVRNDGRGVRIEIEGDDDAVRRFLDRLASDRPAAARVASVTLTWDTPELETDGFRIDVSRRAAEPAFFPAPDLATCEVCRRELWSAGDRRHAYPFVNCTSCGPRFTIIRALPYDRERTSMSGFAMCSVCAGEYANPADRRFHAEPTACPECGPRLVLLDGEGRPRATADPIEAVAVALRSGAIVALKSLGGYHLACDATDDRAVAELRRRKARDAKPFAIMVRDAHEAALFCMVSDAERELLESPARPIVLLARRAGVAPPVPVEAVAPRLNTLGVMLPYTPLHHLLVAAAAGPLVMTSGNRSDEPIAYADDDAVARLRDIADLFLVHDRPIEVSCDDSIAVVDRGAPMVMRRARGYVPLAIPLPVRASRPVLAVGGELKSTFAIVRDGEAFLSPHLGDLGDERAWRTWRAMEDHFERLLEITPAVIAHDLHPGYRSTAYAEARAGVERIAVQHHHAHIASCLADNGLNRKVIGVAWDGTGYGPDGRVWGGEFVVADLLGSSRAGSLAAVPMPGGEAAVREPWRMAAAFLRAAYGGDAEHLGIDFVRRLDRPAWKLLGAAAERGLNAPLTSSAGRLFDAVASLIGVRDRVEFEAQAAMELEALAAREIDAEADRLYDAPIVDGCDAFSIRTTDLIRAIADDLLAGIDPGRIAARFHASLARVVVDGCRRVHQRTGITGVALSGGVFQNRLLSRAAVAGLERAGFDVYTHRQVPPNDGGLSLGQAAIAAARLHAEEGR